MQLYYFMLPFFASEDIDNDNFKEINRDYTTQVINAFTTTICKYKNDASGILAVNYNILTNLSNYEKKHKSNNTRHTNITWIWLR